MSKTVVPVRVNTISANIARMGDKSHFCMRRFIQAGYLLSSCTVVNQSNQQQIHWCHARHR